MERCRDVVDGDLCERRGISLLSNQRCHLAHEALHQVSDGHPTGDGVRVDDDVRGDALAREGHVLLGVRDPDGALLSMPGCKLVAHLRNTDGPHLPAQIQCVTFLYPTYIHPKETYTCLAQLM